jgi:hypothetical protein
MTTQGTPGYTGGTQGDDVKSAVAAESGQVAQTAKEHAQTVATEAKGQAQNVVGEAKGQAQNVVGEAKSQARDLAGEARSQLQQQSDTQRDRVVSTLRELGQELREMADNGNQNGLASELARQASDRVQGVSSYLEGRRPGDLLDDVRDFARRRPGVFLLGAAAAGVLAGRATRGVKAATSGGSSGGSSSGYQGGSYAGGTGYSQPGYAAGTSTGYGTGTGSGAGTGTGYSSGAATGTGTGYAEPYTESTYPATSGTTGTGNPYTTPSTSGTGTGGTADADPLEGVGVTEVTETVYTTRNVEPAYGLEGDRVETDSEWAAANEGRSGQ